MVTKSEYISLLKKPLVTDASLIAQLEELQEKFPFCGNIQMLLTKGYHDTDSINYEEQLKNTAISIPNRESLYNLIFKTFVTEEINENLSTEKVEEAIIESETKPEPIEVVDVIIEETNNTPEVEEKAELTKTEETETKHTEEVEEETVSINEIVKNKKDASDKLEELILSHAIGASYVLEDKTEKAKKEDSPEKTEKEVEEKATPINTKHHSFYSWLTPKEPIIEKTTPSESIDDLVEKFIESKGSEKIKKKDFFSPTNVAKLSIVESDDFVTETLADIYFKQKMYDKALNAYEKLILKNPEKKTYFASQINKIKSLLE